MSKNFIDNIKDIIKNKIHLHHSHIRNKVIGYAHSFCNKSVKENKTKITAVAYNLFRFGFFLLKGLRTGVWGTRNICIGGKNPTNISFANIGNQV